MVTPGDPTGIGPEVTAKALAERQRAGAPGDTIVVGDRDAFTDAAQRFGCALDGLELRHPVGEVVEVAAIEEAVAMIQAGRARALVTGPIHKASLRRRGFAFTGHTDFLGHLCGVRPVMAFTGGTLRVALVTVHLPLEDVPGAVTTDAVLHTIRTASAALERWLGLAAPRLAICGLNPHAGEEGALGRQEMDAIAPAVTEARGSGIDAVGPMSAETAFRNAASGAYDLVVAMYHDQGLVPLKLVDFGRTVNWTLGLPFVRTSVDHGTAHDIAGKGIADPAGMAAALRFADQLTT